MSSTVVLSTATQELPQILSKLDLKGAAVPLTLGNSLDSIEKTDITPLIGTEFKDVQLSQLLKSENANQLIKDLAITSEWTMSSCIDCAFLTSYFLDWQFLREVSYSSETRTSISMIRNCSELSLENCPASLVHLSYTSTPLRRRHLSSETKLASSHQKGRASMVNSTRASYLR